MVVDERKLAELHHRFEELKANIMTLLVMIEDLIKELRGIKDEDNRDKDR